MRVLEINTESTWRGGERQTLYTVQGLRDLGVEVDVLSRKGSPLADRLKREHVRVWQASGQASALLFLALKGHRYDILHAQTAKGQSLAVLTKRVHRRPVVYTRRVDFVPSGRFSLWKYRRTDRIIAISRAIKQILVAKGLVHTSITPSAVVPQELNRARAESLRRELGLVGKKIIGTVAALVPHKDPDTLVDTVSELLERRDDFAILHFGDGPLRGRIERRIEEMDLGRHLLLQGHIPDVEDFFAIFDLFLMTSEEEGLGSSVLDAFTYGVPVVATDAGGLRETVENRGLLCPVKDANCLASQLNSLLQNAELRHSLASTAREVIESVYSRDHMVQETLRIFEEVLHESALH